MATTATTGDVWTRKFLKDHGYTDDQIGFDKDRNMVTAGGVDFYSPAKVSKGMSYGSEADLNAAYGQLESKKGASKSNDLMNQITAQLNKPFEIPQFNFNPQTDPRYQEAMKIADQNATQATGNALASLASRGIENGSIMGDRAAQIQQQERGRVSAELVPQLYNQAYNQFANDLNFRYNQNQDQLSALQNLLGIQNNQNQLLADNAYRDKAFNQDVSNADRSFDRGVLESDRAYDRGVLESDRGYDRGVLESDRNYALDKRQVDNSIANSKGKSSSGGSAGGSSKAASVNTNTIIDNINSLYTAYDRNTGKRVATNVGDIEKYILSLNLPDSTTMELYNYYGIPLDAPASMSSGPNLGPLGGPIF